MKEKGICNSCPDEADERRTNTWAEGRTKAQSGQLNGPSGVTLLA